MLSYFRRLSFVALALCIMIGVAAVRSNQEHVTRHFRIVVGLKDREPNDWKGEVRVEGGELTALTGWRFEDGDAVQGNEWTCKTRNNIAPLHRYPVQDYAGKPKGETELAPWPNGVHISIRGDAPQVTVRLGQGMFTFAAKDFTTGQAIPFLQGKVRVERIPAVTLVRPAAPLKSASAYQDDYPALWIDPATGKQIVAWVSYASEKTRVLMAERAGPTSPWSKPIEVAGPGDYFRVAVAGTAEGVTWLVWSEHSQGAWNLVGQPVRNGKLSEARPLTKGKGPHLWHRMTTDGKGRAWLVWQEFRNGRSIISANVAQGDKWLGEIAVTPDGEGNCWDPVVVGDPTIDRVWIGWDEYNRDNYRVRVASVTMGEETKVRSAPLPEESPNFQAHISLACDPAGRLWAAWDEAGPQWGKDTGFLYGGEKRTDTSRLYASRAIRIRCFVNGNWLDPSADWSLLLPPDLKEYNELPQLQADPEGRIWMAFRHRACRRPRQDGWAAQGRWDVYLTALLGDRWLPPVELPLSGGRNDMRLCSQVDRDGKICFAYASDNRPWTLPGMPPRNHHVAVCCLEDAPRRGPHTFQAGERKQPQVAKIHPKEAEQVARIRNYQIDQGGRTYKIYRGDLHRHTDISGDGPGDGSLMDLHRYAIDAAAMDFVLVADHNMGNDNEYCWWRTQQANDLYTVPGKFISTYGYERSVKYPNGHRNVIWTERGHRTLPLPVKPLPAALKNDTAKLYEYLRRTGGICTSHTSATDQGTDWNDAIDPELEPFVELFQGYHTSYELPGAPKAIDAKSDMIHGPFKADGFVSLALKKGYKLGFQSSSDHISTHVSYACILAEEFSRKGLVEAMKKRHTYAATDNIILDVRMDKHLMGDEVRTDRPALNVIVLGTAPLAKVEILRDSQTVHTQPTDGEEIRFQWRDPNPPRQAYYYVRVAQTDGNMAWSSPIWVLQPK